MSITIIANIHAKVGKSSLVHVELDKLVETTRREPGCIQYILHRDNEDKYHFVFYEIWESRELWQAHMHAPHLAAYGRATSGAIDKFTIHELTQVDWASFEPI